MVDLTSVDQRIQRSVERPVGCLCLSKRHQFQDLLGSRFLEGTASTYIWHGSYPATVPNCRDPSGVHYLKLTFNSALRSTGTKYEGPLAGTELSMK